MQHPSLPVKVVGDFLLSLITLAVGGARFPSRLAGFPPLPPLRTVQATFTAHGSCNSKLTLVLINSALPSVRYSSRQPMCRFWLRVHTVAKPRSIDVPSYYGFYLLFLRESPNGSLPAFAWDDIPIPIRAITARHSLSP